MCCLQISFIKTQCLLLLLHLDGFQWGKMSLPFSIFIAYRAARMPIHMQIDYSLKHLSHIAITRKRPIRYQSNSKPRK